jgi:hypothetical protein
MGVGNSARQALGFRWFVWAAKGKPEVGVASNGAQWRTAGGEGGIGDGLAAEEAQADIVLGLGEVARGREALVAGDEAGIFGGLGHRARLLWLMFCIL